MSEDTELIMARAALWSMARSTQNGRPPYRIRVRSKEDLERMLAVKATPYSAAESLQQMNAIPVDYDPTLGPNEYKVDAL